MDYLILKKHIGDLAEEISYPCKKTDHLTYALKLSNTPGHIFFHSGFEAVGEAILNTVNNHYLFTRGYNTEKQINEALKKYNATRPYAKYVKEHNLTSFIYNDHIFASDAKKEHLIPKGCESAIVKRIIGAMYYDSDWQTVKNWIINTLGIRSMKKTGSIESSN